MNNLFNNTDTIHDITSNLSESDTPTMQNHQPTQTAENLQASEDRPQKKKSRFIFLILLLLLLLGLGTCAAMNFATQKEEQAESALGLMPEIDGNSKEITDRESLEAAMQTEADAHYFTLQVNPEARFSHASGEGSFEIMNPVTNVYPISFTLTLDETGEELYQSGAIMPNQQISTVTITNIPEPGTYEATVQVLIYDDETQKKEGATQAKISVTII